MEFSDKLKTLRIQANMTQSDLAEYLSISRQAVSNYEQGRSYPSLDILLEMSKLFHISLDELLESGTKKRYMKQLLILTVILFLSVAVGLISSCFTSVGKEFSFVVPIFSVAVFAIPFMCLVVYFVFQYNPPKKINRLYGYRTNLSMKNQLLWDYAQSYFSYLYVQIAGILFCLNIVYFSITAFLNASVYAIFSGGFLFLQVLFLPLPVFFVERKLKSLYKK